MGYNTPNGLLDEIGSIITDSNNRYPGVIRLSFHNYLLIIFICYQRIEVFNYPYNPNMIFYKILYTMLFLYSQYRSHIRNKFIQ